MNTARIVVIVPLLTTLLSASPCCADEDSAVRLFWPIPPSNPRMEFVGVFSSANDFPKTKLQESLSALVGELPASNIMHPTGIVSLPDGNVLVAEALGRDVKVFNFPQRQVSSLFQTMQPIFDEPVDIAADADGNIYVADTKKGRIMVFDRQARPLFQLGKNANFKKIEKIAINEISKIIYVSDSILDRVFAFDAQGKLLYELGGGKDAGRLRSPHGMAIDREGRLFVADTGNVRIAIFDSKGGYLDTFKFKKTTSPLAKPWDLAFDSQGNLHIIDQGKFVFLSCRINGEILFVTGASKRTTHPMGFARPSDIHVDGKDRIWVTDALNKRFCVWQLLTATYLTQHPVDKVDMDKLVAYIDDLKKEYARQNPQRDDTTADQAVADSSSMQAGKKVRIKLLDRDPGQAKGPVADAPRAIKCPNCNSQFVAIGANFDNRY